MCSVGITTAYIALMGGDAPRLVPFYGKGVMLSYGINRRPADQWPGTFSSVWVGASGGKRIADLEYE